MLMSSKPCSLALFGGGSASKSGCAQLMQHGWLPRESFSMCRVGKSKKSWALLRDAQASEPAVRVEDN
jgi:hypothetical protein